ncbi:hypothetical protein IJD44_04990 [bacterium]|nr:hypothetical protein [bacterium]
MAGVINAFKNIASDRFWIFKIAIFSIPLYLYFSYKKLVLTFFLHDYLFYLVLGIFYLGISSVIINRNINNKSPILPFIPDAFEVLIKTIGSLLAAIPSLFVICYLFFFIDNFLSVDDANVLSVIKIATVVLLFPFACMPIVVYSVRGNLLDVFKSAKIYFDCGSFVEQFIFFIVQSIFTMGVLFVLVYAFIKQYLGMSPIFINVFYSFYITLYVLMVFSWASDLYGEVIPELKEN